jgi:uncharacterized protein with PQ loop repeat
MLSLFQKNWLENITILIGVLGQVPPYLQAYKIFSLHSAYAISISAQIIALLSVTCWFVYGYAYKIRPLIISNIVGILGVILVLVGVILY